jgi:hypothetical protein
MAESGSLYVTLFSNAYQDTFKKNPHASYTVDLERPVELGSGCDKWEVGCTNTRIRNTSLDVRGGQ